MSVTSKKILYFGMPDMGLVCLYSLLSNNFNIGAVVPPPKNSTSYKNFINFVNNYNLKIIEPQNELSDVDFLDKIASENFDAGVVCSYNKLLPNELLSLPKDGFINVHPSLLPEYRGPNPYSNVIINDEKFTGVTIHFMNDKFDCGDIIFQNKYPVFSDDTMGTLFCRLNQYCAQMLICLLSDYEKNGFSKPRPQIQGDFKYAQNYDINLGNTFIDWNKSIRAIDCFVRGLNPFIGAYTVFRDEFLRINSVVVEKKQHRFEPGTVVETAKSFKIACMDGFVNVTSLQYGSYLVTDGIDFVKRFEVKIGEKNG